jgi:hypothetical protein
MGIPGKVAKFAENWPNPFRQQAPVSLSISAVSSGHSEGAARDGIPVSETLYLLLPKDAVTGNPRRPGPGVNDTGAFMAHERALS